MHNEISTALNFKQNFIFEKYEIIKKILDLRMSDYGDYYEDYYLVVNSVEQSWMASLVNKSKLWLVPKLTQEFLKKEISR